MTLERKKVRNLDILGDYQEGDYVVGERTLGTTGLFTVPALGGGGGTPGGSDTQLQYNDSGSFGGIASLTYNGSNVTSTAGITIDGAADEIQLKLQGHSSQTANIFEIENSAGTDLFAVDNSGNVTVNGTVDGRNLATDGTKLDGIESNATADQTEEEIQDLAWTNVLGGTQNLITVTYQDSTNDVDFVVDNDLANYNNTNSAFITASSANTLTNKIFDANGTGNSISNIDVADLADGTDGELITWDASGNPTTVAVGTSGQVLTSNGAGAAPTFQDASGGGGGKILQIVSTTKTDTFSTTSTTATDITGLSASITPSSSSNTILVMVSVAVANDTNDASVFISTLRDSTEILKGAAAGSRRDCSAHMRLSLNSNHDKMIYFISYSGVDSPASTSTLDYQVQMQVDNTTTGYVNRTADDTNSINRPRTASTITLFEIDGT